MPKRDYKARSTVRGRNVAALLRTVRLRQGLTPEQLAEKIGVNKSQIYRWENARIPLTTITLLEWLISDRHTTLYWKERTMAAENAMRVITDAAIEYGHAIEDLNDTATRYRNGRNGDV